LSLVKIQGNASGTGIFTVAAPNSNTDRTLTLPNETGTVLTNTGPYTASSSATAGAVTIDASNNVGIGTSSPGAKFAVSDGTRKAVINPRSSAAGTGLSVGTDVASSGHVLNLAGDLDGGGTSGGVNVSYYSSASSNWYAGIQLRNTTSSFGDLLLMRDGGNVLVGTTSANGAGGLTVLPNNSAGAPSLITNRTATTAVSTVLQFRDGGTAVGSITHNNTATTYGTNSDYRLKEDVQPMAGALVKVAALKPVTYKWKSDGSEGQGFIAHELQEVVPDCVIGEKDAVDAEGNPVYQGIDTSFLVATLTAAIQELKAELDVLKAQLAGAQA
jgi:hypothetical protein